MDSEEEISTALTIKISATSGGKSSKGDFPNLKNSIESSPYNSPSLLSPPSSAFVSALQSPYISPRAHLLEPEEKSAPAENSSSPACPSPLVSHSDDIPSSSYTPPSDQYEFSDDQSHSKFPFVACVPVLDSAPPRISFSFPVPRISFAKGTPLSPLSSSKLRNCDVFIGFHGQNPCLVRFCKWLKSELELQGIACFVADRSKYSDNQSHEIADRVIGSVTFGVVVLTSSSFLSQFSMEEVRFFAQKKNLIPFFFDMEPSEISSFFNYNSMDKEYKETMQGLMKSHECKLEANEGNWRNCITRAARILRAKLGRMSSAETEAEKYDELPFARNKHFVGREKEIMEMESILFGSRTCFQEDNNSPVSTVEGDSSHRSEGLGDEDESDPATVRGRYINLEIGNPANTPLETWVDSIKGRNSLKRSKHKEMIQTGNCKSSVICISGVPGIGKTELALEFAHKFSQRYKMVLWVGGESRYFRQNILNLSLNLGLDISADAEKDRGRFRSFEEQELEAFKRVKRELFGDMPYLLIIDNLEAEKDWWDGKDLNDLLPRHTGGSHVIITTRLSKVTSFHTISIHPLPLADAMVLMRGRRKKEFPAEELEYLMKFDEKLGRLTYGLWVIGSLLSELAAAPSSLFEAIEKRLIDDSSPCSYLSVNEEQYCKNNPFLMKIINFCFSILEQSNNGALASRIFLVGAWFAPAPVSVSVLAAAAKDMAMAVSSKGFKKWRKNMSLLFGCCSSCLASKAWKSEEESALPLTKFGLARKANKQPGFWIQFHPITQVFAKRIEGTSAANSIVQGVRKFTKTTPNLDHLWASAFLVFGFKSEPPFVQLKAVDMVLYIKRTALPLAIRAFTTFSRCSSALELLKVCTNTLEEVEKSFVSQIQDWCEGSLCWKKKFQGYQRVDEYVWQDVTLLKATLLETRAKLLLRGGHFDSAEELCRTCISIRTVMLGHNHGQTLAAQETLAKIVRLRSKI